MREQSRMRILEKCVPKRRGIIQASETGMSMASSRPRVTGG